MKTEAVLRLDPERSTLKDALAHSVKVAAFHYWSHCIEDGEPRFYGPASAVHPRPLQIELTDGRVLTVSLLVETPMSGLNEGVVELTENGEIRETEQKMPAVSTAPTKGAPPGAPTIPARPNERCPACLGTAFEIDRNTYSTRRCPNGHWWHPGSGNEQPDKQPSPFVPVPPPPERPETVQRDREELVDPDRPDAPPPSQPVLKLAGEKCPECGNLNFRVEPNHFSTRLCTLGHRWRPSTDQPIEWPVDPPPAGTIPTESGGHVKPIEPIQGERCPHCGSDQFTVTRNTHSTRRCLKCTHYWEPGARGTWAKKSAEPAVPKMQLSPNASVQIGKMAPKDQAIRAIQGAADMLREAAKLLAIMDGK